MCRPALSALLLTLAATSFATEPVRLHGTTMGPIVWKVKVDELPADLDSAGLTKRVQTRLDRINQLMSTWEPTSEVSRFNTIRSTEWFDVSPETAAVVGRAIEIGDTTAGAFDVTVAPLVNLWSFGEDEPTAERLPGASAIAKAREHVGWEQLSVRRKPSPALSKRDPELTINLSAIAKGYAVDEVARLLDELGVDGYLVEIGGELRTKGAKPDGSAWRVGIERPSNGPQRVHTALDIGNRALATSGDYRNFFEVDRVRYSHTIDPRTGRPVEHALASVSVVAETCMDADAWATALMVLGPERGYDWAAEQGIPALFLVRNGDTFTERATPTFAALLPTPPPEVVEASPVTTYLIAFGVFLVAIAAMAVGVILGNRHIAGSCGGLASMKDRDGKSICEACTNPLPTCGGVEDGRTRDAELEAVTVPSGSLPRSRPE